MIHESGDDAAAKVLISVAPYHHDAHNSSLLYLSGLHWPQSSSRSKHFPGTWPNSGFACKLLRNCEKHIDDGVAGKSSSTDFRDIYEYSFNSQLDFHLFLYHILGIAAVVSFILKNNEEGKLVEEEGETCCYVMETQGICFSRLKWPSLSRSISMWELAVKWSVLASVGLNTGGTTWREKVSPMKRRRLRLIKRILYCEVEHGLCMS